MAEDVPRCQTVLYVRKSGTPKRCGRPIQYRVGGVYVGWEHVEPYGHVDGQGRWRDVLPDPDWRVDHEQERIVRVEERDG